MKEILIIIAGGYLGWWLAINKEKETRHALTLAQAELSKAKNEIVNQLSENESLKEILHDEEFRQES